MKAHERTIYFLPSNPPHGWNRRWLPFSLVVLRRAMRWCRKAILVIATSTMALMSEAWSQVPYLAPTAEIESEVQSREVGLRGPRHDGLGLVVEAQGGTALILAITLIGEGQPAGQSLRLTVDYPGVPGRSFDGELRRTLGPDGMLAIIQAGTPASFLKPRLEIDEQSCGSIGEKVWILRPPGAWSPAPGQKGEVRDIMGGILEVIGLVTDENDVGAPLFSECGIVGIITQAAGAVVKGVTKAALHQALTSVVGPVTPRRGSVPTRTTEAPLTTNPTRSSACEKATVPVVVQRDYQNQRDGVLVFRGRDHTFREYEEPSFKPLELPEGYELYNIISPILQSRYVYGTFGSVKDPDAPLILNLYCRDGMTLTDREEMKAKDAFFDDDVVAEREDEAFAAKIGERHVLVWTMSNKRTFDIQTPDEVAGISLGVGGAALRLTYLTRGGVLKFVPLEGENPGRAGAAHNLGVVSSGNATILDYGSSLYILTKKRGVVYRPDTDQLQELYQFSSGSGDQAFAWDDYSEGEGRGVFVFYEQASANGGRSYKGLLVRLTPGGKPSIRSEILFSDAEVGSQRIEGARAVVLPVDSAFGRFNVALVLNVASGSGDSPVASRVVILEIFCSAARGTCKLGKVDEKTMKTRLQLKEVYTIRKEDRRNGKIFYYRDENEKFLLSIGSAGGG